jgi:hypothetical protein
MNKLKKFLIGFCLLGWGIPNLWAQQGTIAAGGIANGTGGNVSYSVGQVDYLNVVTENNGSVFQGLQLAYEIYVTGVGLETISLQCSVYPNPTSDNLTLQVLDADTKNMIYRLYNMDGRLLKVDPLEGSTTSVGLGSYTSGVYILVVLENNRELKKFKIVKN